MAALVTPLTVTAPANATDTARKQPVSDAGPQVSRGPDCADNGNVNPCWEYQN